MFQIYLNKPYQEIDFSKIESNSIRCPDSVTATKMEKLIKNGLLLLAFWGWGDGKN